MKSFRDPATGVLTAWGYAEANGSDVPRDEPDDFNLEPGKWKLGNDQWIPVDLFEVEARAYMATIRQTREMILNRLAGISGRAYRAGEIEMAEASDAASTALLDITKAPAVLAATSMDELHDAVLSYYKTLVASIPEGLRSAFNVVDA